MESKLIMKASILLCFACCIFSQSMGANITTEAPSTETTQAPGPDPTTTQAPAPKTTQAPAPKTTQAPAPKTTQAPAPKTTQAPDPKPTTEGPAPAAPPIFVVKDTNGAVCIMLQAYITTYVTVDNTTIEENITSDATVANTSTCGNSTQTISIKYGKKMTLTMVFTNKSNEFSVTKTSVTHKKVTYETNITEYRAGISHCYECNSVFNITLKDKNQNEAVLSTRKLKVQGFIHPSDETPKFGESQQCPLDTETDGYVPIAVGTALAALVVIVLIAYFISRARSRRGYESV